MPGGYHSGGGGYVMSNEALVRVGQRLRENRNSCPEKGTEDVEVNKCLRFSGVHMGNSSDELGRERFHLFSFETHYFGNYPDWSYKYSMNKPQSVQNYISLNYFNK